jgi:putative SOS response-associated peptidase YedK
VCGRYTLATPDPAVVRARFPVGESVEIRPRYNVAPGDRVLAVTTDRDGAPRGELLRWGLVPWWANSPRTGLKMINARAETAARRPAYRRALERFRCLIIADGFYEWAALPDGRKLPHHIARGDGAPFAFAGLWSVWRDDGGEPLRSCAIVTTAANPAVAPLPRLLVGLPASELRIRPVGSAVNDARYDGPDCLAPRSQEGQAALF